MNWTAFCIPLLFASPHAPEHFIGQTPPSVETHLSLKFTLLKGDAPVYDAQFSLDSRRIVSAGSDGSVGIWESDSGRLIRISHEDSDSVWRVSFSPDGRAVASGSGNKYGVARLWDGNTGKLRFTLRTGQKYDYVRAIAFSPNGNLLATGSGDGPVRLWNAHTGRRIAELRGHASDISALLFTRDGRLLISSSTDQTVRIWATQSHSLLNVIRADTSAHGAVTVLPDGVTVVTGGSDLAVHFWNASNGIESRSLKSTVKPLIAHLMLDSAGKTLCAIGYVGVNVWDITTSKMLLTVDWADAAALSPDGRLLAVRLGKDLQLWNVQTGTLLGKSFAHASAYELRFAPDSRQLVTFGDDGIIKQWTCTR